jgi:hypothetical protein
MNQCRSDTGIHTTRQAKNDFLIAHLLSNRGDCFSHIIRHVPIGLAAADVVHKAAQDGGALHGMCDFGMKLHGVQLARLIGHTSDRAAIGRGHQLEAGR